MISEAQKEYGRIYRLKNREQIAKTQRKYRLNNYEKISLKNRRYRERKKCEAATTNV